MSGSMIFDEEEQNPKNEVIRHLKRMRRMELSFQRFFIRTCFRFIVPPKKTGHQDRYVDFRVIVPPNKNMHLPRMLKLVSALASEKCDRTD